MLHQVEFQVTDSTLFLHCPSVKSAQSLAKNIDDICIRLMAMRDEGILDCDEVWIGRSGVCFAHVGISRQVLWGRKIRLDGSLRM